MRPGRGPSTIRPESRCTRAGHCGLAAKFIVIPSTGLGATRDRRTCLGLWVLACRHALAGSDAGCAGSETVCIGLRFRVAALSRVPWASGLTRPADVQWTASALPQASSGAAAISKNLSAKKQRKLLSRIGFRRIFTMAVGVCGGGCPAWQLCRLVKRLLAWPGCHQERYWTDPRCSNLRRLL